MQYKIRVLCICVHSPYRDRRSFHVISCGLPDAAASISKTEAKSRKSSSSFSLFLTPFPYVGFFFFTYGSFRHLVGLFGRGISPAPRPLHKHTETQTHIHALSRIRTCDLNVRAAEESHRIKTGHVIETELKRWFKEHATDFCEQDI
jgi:hypothetical protein